MADNNAISTGKKTVGNFTVEYQKNGYGGCIPVIDGVAQPSLMFGYATESDKEACMRLIEDALRAGGNNVGAIQHYIMQAVSVAANEIKPDEAVMVDGTELILSYSDRKSYFGTREIANLDDISCELPDEAIRAMLIDRSAIALREEMHSIEDEYDDEEWDDEDF